MERGYKLLAEAFMRERNLDDALKALERLPESKAKDTLVRELRNNATKAGRLDLYRQASELGRLPADGLEDLATMLLAGLEQNRLDTVVEVFNLLPESSTKSHLTTTAIIEVAYRGSVISCERIAKACNIQLTKDQALIAKANAIREGWITDAERAAAILGAEITKEEYRTMFVANKDKGLLFDAQEAAKRAGEEIDADSLTALLLAGVKYNRGSVWDVAEML